MSTWRTGTKVGINVYDGDVPVCQCQTREYAVRIVRDVNQAAELRAEVARLRELTSRYKHQHDAETGTSKECDCSVCRIARAVLRDK